VHRQDGGDKFTAPVLIVLNLGLMAMLPFSPLHILTLIGGLYKIGFFLTICKLF
jgi:hypothetical protein